MLRLLLALSLAACSAFAAPTETTFRIRFGLTDVEPAKWDGVVSVAGGEIAKMRSWRPREADRVEGGRFALATTQGLKFRYRNWEPEPSSPVPEYVYIPGLFLTVSSEGDARVDVETAQGNFSFRLNAVPVGKRVHFLEGAVVVERAGSYESLSPGDHDAGFADVALMDDGGYWVAWVGYGDWANRVYARRYEGEDWGEVVELTTGPSDIYYVRLQGDGDGGLWAVWSDRRDDNFDLFARRFDGSQWTSVERLSDGAQSDIHHALARDADGGVWMVWQGFRDGRADILARRHDGREWSPAHTVSTSEADDWNPAIAADSAGNVWVAWDTYDKGDYDIVMRRFDGERWGDVITVADTPRYEAYPSIACDPDGRVWATWNESDMQWGKDTGFLLNRPATQIYQTRWMALAVYENGAWRKPYTPLEQALPEDLRAFNDFPRLVAGDDGRIWLYFRHRFIRQREVPKGAAPHRAAWESYVTQFDGRGWSTPTPLAVSAGRSDAGFGFAVRNGEAVAAWATDNREYDEYWYEHSEVFTGRVAAAPGPVHEPALHEHIQDKLTFFSAHPNEAEDLARIRSYTIESGGKTYRIYRGDTHRHTEYSADGNNDGSLNDTYRYAMNAAELDYLGVSDHHNAGGQNIEYINWLLQQRVDVFLTPGRFTTLFGYERGVGYPNGHRNIFFAERGNPTFPDQPGERESSSARVGLFDYVRKYDGISIPHTPATGMGTDWRDNDPEVEPLVEIFQGDRVSAEYEGAPLAAIEGDVTTQAGGFRPAGYVWNAWAKGYKIGLQASSDHLSTHISFACTIAEDPSREGLIGAMKQRHSYAATDNIVLDYRMRAGGREYLQGDEVEVRGGEAEIKVTVLGTAPIRQIDVIRDQEFLYTIQNQDNEVRFSFIDKDPPAGETYYYVRVQQANDQMAWSSPIWVTR